MCKTTLALMAMAGILLSGCATLSPKEQALLDASETCFDSLYLEGKGCIAPCKATADVKVCVTECADHLRKTSFPACADAYGDLAGPAWDGVVNAAVTLINKTIDAVEPVNP